MLVCIYENTVYFWFVSTQCVRVCIRVWVQYIDITEKGFVGCRCSECCLGGLEDGFMERGVLWWVGRGIFRGQSWFWVFRCRASFIICIIQLKMEKAVFFGLVFVFYFLCFGYLKRQLCVFRTSFGEGLRLALVLGCRCLMLLNNLWLVLVKYFFLEERYLFFRCRFFLGSQVVFV